MYILLYKYVNCVINNDLDVYSFRSSARVSRDCSEISPSAWRLLMFSIYKSIIKIFRRRKITVRVNRAAAALFIWILTVSAAASESKLVSKLMQDIMAKC